MRTTACLALVLAGLSAIAGCAAEAESDTEGSASAVKGGEVAPQSLGRSIVQVYTEQKDSRGNEVDKYCTGILVGPRAVVTSLGCFSAQTWAWSDKGPYQLARAVVATSDTGTVRLLSTPTNVSAMAPVWSKASEKAKSDIELRETSLALLTLTADLPGGVPVAIGEIPTERETVTVAGYGCDASGDDWGKLRQLSLKWNQWNGFWSTSFSCTKAPGDIGAAVLDARGRLVGVATGKDTVLPLTSEVRAQLPR